MLLFRTLAVFKMYCLMNSSGRFIDFAMILDNEAKLNVARALSSS